MTFTKLTATEIGSCVAISLKYEACISIEPNEWGEGYDLRVNLMDDCKQTERRLYDELESIACAF